MRSEEFIVRQRGLAIRQAGHVADLIRVCVAGVESLKSVTAGLKPGISAVQVRRAAYSWHLVLMHGALVSDAFDASIR